ncbi:MAG: O-antigen ligase family protein [Bryobacteraceae bacterium]|jgi:O-antigen ligase/polysaccharide polymerase Wzy-like membrane protein
MRASAVGLFLAAAAATLGIGFREPRVEYGYECVLFILAAGWCVGRGRSMAPIPGLLLAAIAAWGFSQLAMGATVYRYATLVSSLRFAALAATAWVSFRVFGLYRLRVKFLRAFAWFGVAVAVTSVLAYFTSPGRILWLFDAPYPDVWGSFLSRNNFAQFLELAMPVALWLALREPPGSALYLGFAAIMLASGLASASRAGASILVLEAILMLWMYRKSPVARRMTLGLVLATALFAAMPGIGTLAGRLTAADPYQVRREIAHSTVAMISSRPWSGFGLGTFPVVYPEFARFDVGQSVEHAHNDWLEWAAEGGVGFVTVWIGLALWSARLALLTGWGIGVVGCFLHGLVDYPFARFGVSAWIFILLGILAAIDLRELRAQRY